MHTGTPATFLAAHGLQRSEGRAIPGTPTSVAELVDAAAERHPTHVAIADRRTSYTFDGLRDAVDRAAASLRACGLEPFDRVAVSLPNSTDVVIAFLATMRAGMIWVGVNTHLAAPEQAYLCTDTGANALISSSDTAARILGAVEAQHGAAAARHIHRIDVDLDRPGQWFVPFPPARFDISSIDPHGPAAIAATSGTTGRPKGAVHSQHNMLLPAAVIHAAEPTPLVQGVILPLTILNMQILGTVHGLLSGSTVVPADRIDVVGVAAAIRDFGIQRIYATPPTVYDLLTRPDIDPAAIATLTHLGVGGAKLPAGMRDRYRERFGRDFVVGYGLTEAPTSVTGDLPDAPSSPIGSSGRTRAHVVVTIRDAHGAVLAPGEEGEICVEPAGSGRFAHCYTPMLGYWERPDATAETLRDGVLHTGDIGVVDTDGALWVRDRRSDLIIRGGANVYPAEIERVIESTGWVSEVAVVGRDHPRLGEEVVAFVSAAPGHVLEADRLAAACRAELAAYKVPISWYETTSFPRNAMGKVVKPRLRAWLEGTTDARDLDARELLDERDRPGNR